jgi:hypothetical protein
MQGRGEVLAGTSMAVGRGMPPEGEAGRPACNRQKVLRLGSRQARATTATGLICRCIP